MEHHVASELSTTPLALMAEKEEEEEEGGGGDENASEKGGVAADSKEKTRKVEKIAILFFSLLGE